MTVHFYYYFAIELDQQRNYVVGTNIVFLTYAVSMRTTNVIELCSKAHTLYTYMPMHVDTGIVIAVQVTLFHYLVCIVFMFCV